MIYLRFIDGGGIDSRIIRFGTRWWCSHVEFLDTSNVNTERATLGARLKGGVQFRPLTYDKSITREEWWTAPGIDKAFAEAQKYIGCGYDLVDIAGFATARDWHSAKHMICSELVTKSFEDVGVSYILLSAWQPVWRISPRDVMISPVLRFIKRVM